jgi:hypothetical protein
VSLELAAIEVIGCEADEGGDLFAAHLPDLLMRARALATVRVWKKRPEHQAHSRSDIRDACGLPVATGAEL